MLCTLQAIHLSAGKEEWMDGYWIGSTDGWEGPKESSPTSRTQQQLVIGQLTPKMKCVHHSVVKFYSGLILPACSMRDMLNIARQSEKAYLA